MSYILSSMPKIQQLIQQISLLPPESRLMLVIKFLHRFPEMKVVVTSMLIDTPLEEHEKTHEQIHLGNHDYQ